MNWDGKEGEKFYGKSKKQEDNSESKKWHILVCDQQTKPSGLKHENLVLPKGFETVRFL